MFSCTYISCTWSVDSPRTPQPIWRWEPPLQNSNKFIFHLASLQFIWCFEVSLWRWHFRCKSYCIVVGRWEWTIQESESDMGWKRKLISSEAPIKPGWRFDYIAVPKSNLANKARDKKNLPQFHEDYLIILQINQILFDEITLRSPFDQLLIYAIYMLLPNIPTQFLLELIVCVRRER